jgi:hypothetical protein
MKQAPAVTERVIGKAAGVDADGTPATMSKTAYEKVRELQQEQLRLVRKQIELYREEENRLMEALAKYPPPGQLSFIEGE